MRPGYFCRKYGRWLTRREIEEVHKGRCFNIRRGHRKGRRCKMLVEV